MIKLSSFIALLLISNFALANYVCTDGTVKVEVTIDGPVPEEFDFDNSIFQNNHVIKITTPNTVMVFDKLVVATEDGAGQESFQAFVPDRLAPLKMVVDFYFEHEGGYLAGGFQEILNYGQEGVMPYDYEYGDFYNFGYDVICDFN
jgi:hypothetical protein